MEAVRHRGFHIFAIFVKNSNLRLFIRRHAKFGEDRTIHGRVIAYFRFSKWRPSDPYDVIADHPRSVFDGPKILLKLHVDMQDIAKFIFGPFGLKLLIHVPFGEFLGDITPNEFR